jgi:hypothetical protein
VAQFGSAPALGAGGRRFKSSHPDMEILFGLTIVMVVIEAVAVYYIIRHVKQISSGFNKYVSNVNDSSEINETINIYQEKILELEEKNKKLTLENKLLQEKISKISKQMKQISDHFKPN